MAGKPKGRQYSRLAAAAIVDRRLTAEVLRVLAMLGIFADKFGYCFPAVTTIAHNLGIERRTVQRHLRKLEELGHIQTVPTTRSTAGGHGRNRYWLAYSAVHLEQAPPRKDKKRKSGATPGVAPECASQDIETETPRRHYEATEATPGVAPGATFEDLRGDAGCRPIIPMGINPLINPGGNQPIGRADARAGGLSEGWKEDAQQEDARQDRIAQAQRWANLLSDASREAERTGDYTRYQELANDHAAWIACGPNHA
jgi:hypothetical protein